MWEFCFKLSTPVEQNANHKYERLLATAIMHFESCVNCFKTTSKKSVATKDIFSALNNVYEGRQNVAYDTDSLIRKHQSGFYSFYSTNQTRSLEEIHTSENTDDRHNNTKTFVVICVPWALLGR